MARRDDAVERELEAETQWPDLTAYSTDDLHEKIKHHLACSITDQTIVKGLTTECLRRETVQALADATGLSRAAAHRWPKRTVRP